LRVARGGVRRLRPIRSGLPRARALPRRKEGPMRAIAIPRREKPARASMTTRARVNASTVLELASLVRRTGRFWLIPMLAVLGLATVLLLVVQAIEYVAPFVYTVF